ncbi:DNA/RNA-binding protein KIN17 domain-containing protein [Toxoplasma gondii TgCatPRC2]|uniref:DNA/RNA-binding protein KIN17 n=8 Tax=Toxoplasma gondii TaxID=5811 RepID=V4Z9P9_TOXGV|nr:DNA/RNA-binding protein KIN17 domain-containing protein [Toxoplasma gondii VEG]KFG40120.1 DNA/RNA-binding protein KIN17 domain-containing protein [Toxoplasma gondii GAB2-2007-GAL-DOM2]KFG44747.1 DNA/RNA-binding protein KIN17 domain-containing protein [Toxoplasma gondii p89]KFG63215.1 DNA/RNA-binding protein KIN17 domain-containing protein [Toxoplasma gondii RUB]KFH06405.1 DNA/RNA-binding protein KIN17 domain-containing protein [Toxoplasma gondii MAS]KFH08426.1 DNA/RNA-binding protein KIN17 
MPKAEFGTTKWMSNKIKAAGLQKLRWYCQMCEKQCRDENGFKCHRMSEGHQRMMQIFIQNPTKFMDDFSQEFEREFMRLMRTRYCRTRVLANSVYNNIVADRQHIHMNSTIWVTLSEFVQYLGSTNKCKIELTPKGWYVEYIDHDERRRLEEQEKRRKVELSQEEAKARRLEELVEEAKKRGGYRDAEYTPLLRRNGDEKIVLKGLARPSEKSNEMSDGHSGERPANALKLLEAELKRKRRFAEMAKSSASSETGVDERSRERGSEDRPSLRQDEDGVHSIKARSRLSAAERLRLEIEQEQARARGSPSTKRTNADELGRLYGQDREDKNESGHFRCSGGRQSDTHSVGLRGGEIEELTDRGSRGDCEHSKTELHESDDDERKPPAHKYRNKDWWIKEGCIVKVMHAELGDGQYYKQKGKILRVEERYAAYVKMLESGDLIRLDQKMLETVIPNIGGRVRIVLGEWRDHEGKMEGIDMDAFCVHVVVDSGPVFKVRSHLAPIVVKNLPYEHVCKIA